MQAFHIRYRNTQGTLMRILNAASRRGLDLPSVHAEAVDHDHRITMLLDVTPKQVGQLYREWYAIADVMDVRGGALREHADTHAPWTAPHPPASESLSDQSARAARA